MIKALCPIKHPDFASRKFTTYMYTANKRGDNMAPYLTPYKTVKRLEVDWPHLIHISYSLCQKIYILTINHGTFLTISFLKSF